jgi:hypothetical protein
MLQLGNGPTVGESGVDTADALMHRIRFGELVDTGDALVDNLRGAFNACCFVQQPKGASGGDAPGHNGGKKDGEVSVPPRRRVPAARIPRGINSGRGWLSSGPRTDNPEPRSFFED